MENEIQDQFRKAELDAYVRQVYSIGIGKYMEVLRKHRLEGMNRILDVGCGAGQWMMAAAILNPEAEVYGIETDRYLLEHAKKVAFEMGLSNAYFIVSTYEELSKNFKDFSVDLILCNSVVQYIDADKMMDVFSKLLKPEGHLLMCNNHGFGYYLRRLIRDIARLQIINSLYPLKVLLHTMFPRSSIFGRNISDKFISLKRIVELAAEKSILMEKIENEFSFGQPEYFCGFTCMFSCKGTKKK